MNIYFPETWESRGETEDYEKENVEEEREAQWESEGWDLQKYQLHLLEAFLHMNNQLTEVTQQKSISSAFF